MTDYVLEQEMEIEALEAILMDDFKELHTGESGLSTSRRCFQIAISPQEEEADGQINSSVRLALIFSHTEKYPDEPPLLDVKSLKGIQPGDLRTLKEKLEQEATENLGMAMIFTLVTSAKEWLSELFAKDADDEIAGQADVARDEHGNNGDFCVPKFYHIRKHPKNGNIEKIIEKGKDTPSSSNVCNRIQSSSEKPSKESPNVIKKRNHLEKESCNLVDEYFEDDDEYGKMEKSDKKRSASMMEDHDRGPSQAGRNGDISNASDVNLSPDDIVKLLGQKLFWKARKTILHQQRIFVLQIFELHRLIKVQKMIARSPDILFEDNFYTGKSLMTSPSTKKLPCTDAVEPKTYSSPKRKGICGTRAENIRNKKPILHEEPYSALASPAHEAKSGPWCLPGNQWLVPLRSPSEGLVYKPYSGPCPPPGAILTPLYGGCRPLNISYGIGLFPTPSVGQAYFQPYGMPVINSSTRDPSLVKPYGTKVICNTSNGAQSGIVSNGAHQSLQTDRGSDLQGSTASSPSKRDALSLFPTKPTREDSERLVHNQDSRQAFRVIKAVPHNPNTASETAARIFKSIQEERKQH